MLVAPQAWLSLFVVTSAAQLYERPTLHIDAPSDWLLQSDPRASPNIVELRQLDNQTIALTNGLLARVFAVAPFFATWDIATSKGSALRGISEEATVTLDGRTYNVGGAFPLLDDGSACPLPHGVGPTNNCPTAYMNRSTPYGPNASAFTYMAHWTSKPTAPFPWRRARHAPDMPWPPLGLRLSVNMSAPADCAPAHKDVVVTMHYEMYQGIPAMSKWLTVTHTGTGVDNGDANGSLGNNPVASHEHGHSHTHEHTHDRAHSHSHSRVGLPVDQTGPINIQACDTTLPPSDWESRWLLTPDVAGLVRLSGGRSLCLAITQGQAYHEFNDQIDALPCNASDPLQQWMFDTSSGLMLTRASNESIYALTGAPKLPCEVYPPTTPPSVNTKHCGIDINNHQADVGTTAACSTSGGVKWKIVVDTSGGKAVQLRADDPHYPDRCLWFTPLPKPPPPPPPPAPKSPCKAPNCVVLDGATVEILRVNAPWSPASPLGYGQKSDTQPVESGSYATPTRQLPANFGLMYPRITQAHGTKMQWGLDPTFDPLYSGNDGAIQPLLTAGYDSAPGKYGGPGARIRAAGSKNVSEPNNPFDSFRVMTLYGDSTEDERMGLGVRKLTRLLAPQTSEAPLFMHLTDISPAGVRNAVDQIVATGGGFDMIIFSFGSGFHLESKDPKYWAQIKASVDYAKVSS
jgi:hypothetical protein